MKTVSPKTLSAKPEDNKAFEQKVDYTSKAKQMYRQLRSQPNTQVKSEAVRAAFDQEIEAARVAYERSKADIKYGDPQLEQKHKHMQSLELKYYALLAQKRDFEREYGADGVR